MYSDVSRSSVKVHHTLLDKAVAHELEGSQAKVQDVTRTVRTKLQATAMTTLTTFKREAMMRPK
jgi:hypothetical protein